jgi:ABC-type thiamin/hydroxymethylpyrimidine transport system permease subunit
MNLDAVVRRIEETAARPVVVDPRLLRRVIKEHRRTRGLGLEVPHGRCYALARAELTSLPSFAELARPLASLPDDVLLLARPEATEERSERGVELTLVRAAYHASLHRALERRVAAGELAVHDIRSLVQRIGQTEMDEVRAVLRQDDLLLPPADDREAVIELVALFHELSRFAPTLFTRLFPSLGDQARLAALFEPLVPAAELLERCRPANLVLPGQRGAEPPRTASPTFVASPTLDPFAFLARRGPPSDGAAQKLVATADAARARGNLVRAALSLLEAAEGRADDARKKLRAAARADLDALGARLNRALGESSGDPAELAWTALLFIVAEEANARRGVRHSLEARLLFDLQRAAIASEQELRAVDVVSWALSFGRRPVVRELPATRPVRTVRAIGAAQNKLKSVRIADSDRRLLARLLRAAHERAGTLVRRELGASVTRVLDEVGLRPRGLDEAIARDKLVAELFDQVTQRGYFALPHLRDALSRNQLKLPDLASGGELWSGDPLLRVDALLAVALDGVYRPGEIYLRALQKISSTTFGTRAGRLFTLYVALPFGGAFLGLEGAAHIASPLSRALGGPAIHLVSWTSFAVTSLVLFALMHSPAARRYAWTGLRALGTLLRALFLTAPGWVFAHPLVWQALESRAARLFVRQALVPGLTAGVVWLLAPFPKESIVSLGLAATAFIVLSIALATRAGRLAFELAFDAALRTTRHLGYRILPGLFGLVMDFFRTLLELLERGLYRVDEWLRFKKGEGRIALYAKATTGAVWFVVAYVARLYATLLIEPEINPLKHFPVVTVAQKMMLPYTPQILDAVERPLAPLGAFLGGTIAGTTVFLLPSIFGFLAWELKENWKLYRASRSATLRPVMLGDHGETMAGLLISGFHSGTVPKGFGSIRRLAQRADGERAELATGNTTLGALPAQVSTLERAMHTHREHLRDAERAVRRFFERELLALLTAAGRWPHAGLAVEQVDLGSNRIRVRLSCRAVGPELMVLSFEEQSRLIVASIVEPGFAASLADDHATVLENALAGLYALAAVDLVREQIVHAIGSDVPYDVSDEGLVLWPTGDYRTEVVYALDTDAEQLAPLVRGAVLATQPRPLDARAVIFRRNEITWNSWRNAFDVVEGPVPRLLAGPPLFARARPAPRTDAEPSTERSPTP